MRGGVSGKGRNKCRKGWSGTKKERKKYEEKRSMGDNKR